MKDASDVVALVADYGTFLSLADKLSETFKQTYYYTPTESEYRNCQQCIIGDGLTRDGHRIERIDSFLSPFTLENVDLFIFPDIGWGEEQKLLRSLGKVIWGSMGGDCFELYRTKFLDMLKEVGLPMSPSVKIKGLTNLSLHLQKVEDKWIKINRFRDNMETWHHQDWPHSERKLEELAIEFGGVKEHIIFVVQDTIPTDVETGYDGWLVNGEYPEVSYQGYEKKNELYLAAQTKKEELPDEVNTVNDRIAPVLEKFGFTNFLATEIRVKDKTPYFIDPTFRMPGQSGEHLLESCLNLADVIWNGANGKLICPEFGNLFAAEATLHHEERSNDWKVLRVPEKVECWFKGYHYCIVDDLYQFPPHANDEVGVILGIGDTIEDAINHLKENLEAFDDEPVKAKIEGFVDLIKSIEEAEKEGIEFTDQPIPPPEIVLS